MCVRIMSLQSWLLVIILNLGEKRDILLWYIFISSFLFIFHVTGINKDSSKKVFKREWKKSFFQDNQNKYCALLLHIYPCPVFSLKFSLSMSMFAFLKTKCSFPFSRIRRPGRSISGQDGWIVMSDLFLLRSSVVRKADISVPSTPSVKHFHFLASVRHTNNKLTMEMDHDCTQSVTSNRMQLATTSRGEREEKKTIILITKD